MTDRKRAPLSSHAAIWLACALAAPAARADEDPTLRAGEICTLEERLGARRGTDGAGEPFAVEAGSVLVVEEVRPDSVVFRYREVVGETSARALLAKCRLAEPRDARSRDVEPRDVEPSDAEPPDAEPPDVEPSVAEPPEVGAPAAASVLRVAVYDLELSDVDARVGAVVTAALLDEIRKLQGVAAIGMDEIRAMLDHEAKKQLLGCEADESCLADIAGALGVDVIVVGTLARLEGQHIIGIKRIDQRRAETQRTANRRLEAQSGVEFLAVVGELVAETFPDHPLRAGETRGVSEELALMLHPPPLPVWLFWTEAAATGVLGVGALAAGAGFLYAQYDYRALADASVEAPLPARELKDKADVVWTTWGVFLGAGAATLVAGAVLGVSALFVDWHGYGQAALE